MCLFVAVQVIHMNTEQQKKHNSGFLSSFFNKGINMNTFFEVLFNFVFENYVSFSVQFIFRD